MLSFSTSTLISALALCSALTGLVHAAGPRTRCTEKYRIPQSNVSCAAIEAQGNVNTSAIESMNPGVNCSNSSTLTAGNYLCTRQYTPVCTLNVTATSDTCDDMANQYNLTLSDFVEDNEDVNDACDNLVVGNPYCVSVDGCYPGNTAAICEQ